MVNNTDCISLERNVTYIVLKACVSLRHFTDKFTYDVSMQWYHKSLSERQTFFFHTQSTKDYNTKITKSTKTEHIIINI